MTFRDQADAIVDRLEKELEKLECQEQLSPINFQFEMFKALMLQLSSIEGILKSNKSIDDKSSSNPENSYRCVGCFQIHSWAETENVFRVSEGYMCNECYTRREMREGVII